MKPYLGLPQQALCLALPKKVYHLPPFGYSMWLFMVEDQDIRKTDTNYWKFHIMGHSTPVSTVPRIQLFMCPGYGEKKDMGRVEMMIGNLHLKPQSDVMGLVKVRTWTHVAWVMRRRTIILYVDGVRRGHHLSNTTRLTHAFFDSGDAANCGGP